METVTADHDAMANTEGKAAREWRDRRGLSRRQLAEITGYSESTITAVENGYWPNRDPIPPATALAYRLACAAVHVGAEGFDWRTVELRVNNARLRFE